MRLPLTLLSGTSVMGPSPSPWSSPWRYWGLSHCSKAIVLQLHVELQALLAVCLLCAFVCVPWGGSLSPAIPFLSSLAPATLHPMLPEQIAL